MRHMRGAEQKVAGADSAHLVLDPVTAGSRGYEIEFVAQMRNLRAMLINLRFSISSGVGRKSGSAFRRFSIAAALVWAQSPLPG